MIRVIRSAKPPILVKNERKWLVKLRQARRRHGKDSEEARRARDRYNHENVRSDLESLFHGKCAYCESKILHVTYAQIEHYRPKSKYPARTFDWDNLLLACGKCNSSTYKGDRFPKTWEGGWLLNPCLDEPEDHLAFVYDSVAGLASVTGKTVRGTTTERILGLNRPELREYRSKFVKKLAALSRLATGDNEAAQLIVEASVDSEEYAAFARALQQASKGKT